MAGSAAFGFGFTEVAGVAVNLELHVAGEVTYFCVGVRGAIVKEHGAVVLGVSRGVGLFGRERAESDAKC